jgi:hypothetical protein
MKTAAAPIPFAGSQLGEARHVCAFFNSNDEEYRVLLPFIKDGFACGDETQAASPMAINPGTTASGLPSRTVTTSPCRLVGTPPISCQCLGSAGRRAGASGEIQAGQALARVWWPRRRLPARY